MCIRCIAVDKYQLLQLSSVPSAVVLLISHIISASPSPQPMLVPVLPSYQAELRSDMLFTRSWRTRIQCTVFSVLFWSSYCVVAKVFLCFPCRMRVVAMGNWMVNDVCCYLDGTVSRQGGVTRGGGPTGDATPGLDMPRPPASTDAGGGIETREGARRLAFGGQG